MAKTQMFCIPYAGGSSSFYNILPPALSNRYEIIPIEVSGHGMRIDEPLFSDMHRIVMDVYQQIETRRKNVPFVLLGYSMGTDICYELAHLMFEKEKVMPNGMFLFANTPPHDVSVDCYQDTWSEQEFIDVLVGYGGLTREVLENKEFRELFLPILRNDFKAEKNYQMSVYSRKISCDAIVFFCEDDNESGCMLEWSNYFDGKCKFHKIAGNHFFINENTKYISDVMINSGF